MTFWLRRELGGFVLAALLLSLPGQGSASCACGPRAMARMSRACPRCHVAAPSRVPQQISRASCCKFALGSSTVAATPAPLQLDRPDVVGFSAPAPAGVTAVLAQDPGLARAPPEGAADRSTAPPAPYLSAFLRL